MSRHQSRRSRSASGPRFPAQARPEEVDLSEDHHWSRLPILGRGPDQSEKRTVQIHPHHRQGRHRYQKQAASEPRERRGWERSSNCRSSPLAGILEAPTPIWAPPPPAGAHGSSASHMRAGPLLYEQPAAPAERIPSTRPLWPRDIRKPRSTSRHWTQLSPSTRPCLLILGPAYNEFNFFSMLIYGYQASPP